MSRQKRLTRDSRERTQTPVYRTRVLTTDSHARFSKERTITRARPVRMLEYLFVRRCRMVAHDVCSVCDDAEQSKSYPSTRGCRETGNHAPAADCSPRGRTLDGLRCRRTLTSHSRTQPWNTTHGSGFVSHSPGCWSGASNSRRRTFAATPQSTHSVATSSRVRAPLQPRGVGRSRLSPGSSLDARGSTRSVLSSGSGQAAPRNRLRRHQKMVNIKNRTSA